MSPSILEKINELLSEYQELPEFSGIELKSINQRGGFDSTPLHIAIYRGNPSEVRLLLDAGADPNAEGEYKERPLHVAINCGNPEIIKMLLMAGAKPELKNGEEQTVFQFAEILGRKDNFQEIIAAAARQG